MLPTEKDSCGGINKKNTMGHILELENNHDLLGLFKDIADGNVMLFLGAGASIVGFT
jgi:hypothetical protein